MNTIPIPDDPRCTGVTSIDDGVTRHESECPVHVVRSWAPEVYVDRQWSGNGLRFATKEEAESWGIDRLMRWFLPTDSRAVESPDYPNYRWDGDGSVTALCREGGCGMPVADTPSRLCAGHHRMLVGDPSAEIAPNH